MGRKLNAELWDKMHYLFRDFNDRMVHVELEYDFIIDIEVLKTVLICFFEKAPVLLSSFHDNHIRPYWKVNKYRIDDVLTVKNTTEDELAQEVDDFLTQYIPPENQVQMKVCVFFHGNKTTLCIVENHMCMDGGDLKYFIYALCQNYNDYKVNNISPINLKEGNRSYTEVYSNFKPSDQRAAQNLYKNINKKDEHRFPLTEPKQYDKSFITRREISAEKFLDLKSTGKKHGATINDMLMAAYYYSLYELAKFDKTESVSISCAIDLRRHIKNPETTGITNHTAWMQCVIPELGNNIYETLKYAIDSTNKFKADKFMGLYGLPLLSFGYKILPHAASEEIIKIGYSNPYIAMSNIGLIDVKKLTLEGNEPIKGFMSGAVKYKPYVLLSATTMRSQLTLSMCVKGNNEDKKIVNNFFDLMEKNINLLISEG